MKTEQEIKQRLSECELQFNAHQEWYRTAVKAYDAERKMWGSDADNGEMLSASEAVSQCKNEIALLRWVLNESL